MSVPFLQPHNEEQYLDLETTCLNLFISLQSLLTITEGEDLDSNSKKLIHFGALCIRINQIVEEYAPKIQKVRESMFKGDSATTNTSFPEPSGDVQVIFTKKEYALAIAALEHLGHSFPDNKESDKLLKLSSDLKNYKRA